MVLETRHAKIKSCQIWKWTQRAVVVLELLVVINLNFFFFFLSDVESLKNQITFMIEQITLQGINTKFSSNVKLNSSAFNEKNDLNSHGGLLKEYGKLQIQLKQLNILEKRMKKQLSELHQNENDLLQNIQKFNNLDVLRNEYASKYEELSTNLQELKDKKRVTENVVAENERRNLSIKVCKVVWFLTTSYVQVTLYYAIRSSYEAMRHTVKYRTWKRS